MITTKQFSFIQFASDNLCCCDVPLVVSNMNDLNYYIEADESFQIGLSNLSGGQLALSVNQSNTGWFNLGFNPADYFACGDCFRILIKTITKLYWSNLLIYDATPKKSLLVQYRSADETYFPFGENENRVRLPMILSSPNPVTEKEDYIDANGIINNPFKTRRQKYELIIDHIPIEMHKKIQVMLMHRLWVDGTRMIETGDYKIDWDNVDASSGIDLIMAKTEISEQEIVSLRNC